MDFLKTFISDLRVEVADEFDRNFERKGFFDEKWPDTRIPNRRGTLMMRTGALRRSIESASSSNSIKFFSSLPYASIHNDGGYITVTAKMKKYFWAMYMKAGGARKGARMNKEAEIFKAMALKKVGSRIKVEKRQFIGPHVQIDQAVDRIFQQHLNDFTTRIQKQLKP
jgi:phage gpG-like protein